MKITKKIMITLIALFLITLGNITENGGGVPSAFAATNVFHQDGIESSQVPMTLKEVQGTTFTQYQNWPREFTKGSSSFVGGVFDGENVWMIPYNASHLIKINSTTGEMTAYDNWPDGFTKGSNAFAGGVFDGTDLWLIPYSANQVIQVNITTGEMTGYSNWPDGSRGNDQFMGGTFDGTNIWLAPYSGSRVIKLDTRNGEMAAYNSWPSGTILGSYPFYGAIFDGADIWLIPNGADRLIKIDPSTGDMTGYTNWPTGFTKGAEAFRGGTFDGENIWLIPYNATHVIKVNPTTGVMTGYDGWPEGFTKGSGSFAGGVYDGKNIWLIPLNSSLLVKVNASTGVMTSYNNWPTGFTKGNNAFLGGVYDGENIWMVPFMADRALRFGSITLSGLTLSSGDLSPIFDGVTKNYRVDVDNDVTSIDITPTVENTHATITVDGTLVVNGESHTVQVKVGANPILVTAQTSNEDAITYEVIVTRAQSDSTISPIIADFDVYRGAHNYQDIDIQLDLLGNTLQQIELDGAPVATDNYVVNSSGEEVTFKKAYLETLSIGTHTFVFTFNAGNTATFGLTVSDSTPDTYKVTYDGNGHISGSVPEDKTVYERGTLVTVLDNTGLLEKTGYTFSGWNSSADGTGDDYAGNATFQMGEADLMLYAKWTVNKYSITFESEGGSIVQDVVADYASNINAPTPPTRSGRTFVGWFTDTALTTPWDFAVDIVQGDLTLYAKWKVKPTPPPALNIQATMTVDQPLTEELLDGSSITINISDTSFMMSLTPEYFKLQNAPKGLTIREVNRISSTEAVITFAFDGTHLEENHDLGLIIHNAALTNRFNVTVNGTLQIQKNKTPYKIITKEGTFEPTKVWTVKLSNEVDASTVQDALYIVDAEGNHIPARFTSEGVNIFIHPPTGNYADGTYTLYITSKLKNKNGTDLKEPIHMIFTIGSV